MGSMPSATLNLVTPSTPNFITARKHELMCVFEYNETTKTSITSCDLYQKLGVYYNIERCSVLGGDIIKVKYRHVCNYDGEEV